MNKKLMEKQFGDVRFAAYVFDKTEHTKPGDVHISFDVAGCGSIWAITDPVQLLDLGDQIVNAAKAAAEIESTGIL